MRSKRRYLIVTIIVLFFVMGLSQSRAQRTTAGGPAAQATPSCTPAAVTELTKALTEIKSTIERYNAGQEAGAYEETKDFCFTACSDCRSCTLTWTFKVYEQADTPGARSEAEEFKVNVDLGAIDPKRVFVEGSQVRFGTNNGQTIAVTIPRSSKRAAQQDADRKLLLNAAAVTDNTDAWRISLRNDQGAEQVADLLKQTLSKACAKP